ncbi:MAG TPA: acyl-CoA synthetase [Acidimicrobiales bacterium]|nr:acyl-CoA synthetase [Acidimicrobiales bacterium]
MEFNLAQVHDAIAAAVPDRECVVWRDRRLTYAQFAERTNRLANHLVGAGLGAHTPRTQLAGHESGQDHLAVYLHNGNEYLEAMLASYKARVVPLNVNYRYVAEELRYLLNDSQTRALVFHGAFADRVAEIRAEVPTLRVLLQVDDGSSAALLDGAVWYEDALAAANPDSPPVEPSPDDLYILYTGGTTGMPKGVLWRQADIFVASLGGRAGATEWDSLDAIVETAKGGGGKVLPAPPFMHGAGHWVAFSAFTGGNTVVIQDDVVGLDPDDIWRTIEREKAGMLLIVGDAFGRPLVDQLEAKAAAGETYDLSALFVVISGGAPLNSTLKDRLLAQLPGKMIIDAVGASETGTQMSNVSAAAGSSSTGTFTPGPGAVIVSADMSTVLDAGHEETGWLAQQGRVPLGYLGDPDKTARTFPVIDGVRYSVPGDRARLTKDNIIELYGRDSVTINSGGEKIFAEEVEQALAHHPDVYDVTVAGRVSEKWGQEVVAIVQLRDGVAGDDVVRKSLLLEAEKHVARFKLPKAFKFVDQVQRSPSGKADYRWAKEQAEATP